MKKEFVAPELKLSYFCVEDILTTSSTIDPIQPTNDPDEGDIV